MSSTRYSIPSSQTPTTIHWPLHLHFSCFYNDILIELYTTQVPRLLVPTDTADRRDTRLTLIPISTTLRARTSHLDQPPTPPFSSYVCDSDLKSTSCNKRYTIISKHYESLRRTRRLALRPALPRQVLWRPTSTTSTSARFLRSGSIQAAASAATACSSGAVQRRPGKATAGRHQHEWHSKSY